MSEYESIKRELAEVKDMLGQLLNKEDQKPLEEWVSAETACELLGITKSTLASYRHKRLIEYRGPRPFEYSMKSINQILKDRTIKKVT